MSKFAGAALRRMVRRMGHQCAYCGANVTFSDRAEPDERPTRDHIVPRSRGGTDAKANIAIACADCNVEKGKLDGEEFIAWKEGRASRLDRCREYESKDRTERAKRAWDKLTARRHHTHTTGG